MKIKFSKLNKDAFDPVRATKGAACFDLHACCPDGLTHSITNANNTATIRTGLSVEVPDGHAMLIYSRSGHGFKSDIRLANCVGVIDSDYRGEIMVKLTQDSRQEFNTTVRHGDRIAQAMIMPIMEVEYCEVPIDTMNVTERGSNGLGSTGT